MKVAFVTSEYPPYSFGGAGISSKLIVEALKNRGVDVKVFSTADKENVDVQSTPQGIEFIGSNKFSSHKMLNENISIIKRNPNFSRFDIVHTYNVRHQPTVRILSDTPVVSTHNNLMWACIDPSAYLRAGCPTCNWRDRLDFASSAGYSGFSRLVRWGIEEIGIRVANRSDIITVQTPSMRDILTNCGYNPNKIEVVPNIVDNKFFTSDKSGNSSDRILLYVGRLAPEKGPLDVIEGFKSLPSRVRENWSLRLYGDGPLKNKVESVTSDTKDIILRYADYSDLPEVYSRADAFIHSAKWPEPFSRTWMEAAGSFTPIISSKNPSALDVLGDNATYFDPFDQSSINSNINHFLSHIETMDKKARAARESMESYRPENVVPEYMDIYKKAIQNSSQ